MDTERAALTRQALAGLASLENLGTGAPLVARAGAPAVLARLSAADLEAIVASLAILLEGMRRLDASAEDGGAGVD